MNGLGTFSPLLLPDGAAPAPAKPRTEAYFAQVPALLGLAPVRSDKRESELEPPASSARFTHLPVLSRYWK